MYSDLQCQPPSCFLACETDAAMETTDGSISGQILIFQPDTAVCFSSGDTKTSERAPLNWNLMEAGGCVSAFHAIYSRDRHFKIRPNFFFSAVPP
jgi:hypothetical protein